MTSDYNGGLTREQFLFYEIRTVASLLTQGLSRKEILYTVLADNLFQFPTERMVSSILTTCFKRIDALDSETLIFELANAPADVAKQINLYAYNLSSFKAEVEVATSHVFFGWIFGLGGRVVINGPQRVKDEYEKMVRDAAANLSLQLCERLK